MLAVALAIGKIAPDVARSSARLPFALLGIGYAVLGVAVVAYGLWRGRAVDRAIRAGNWLNLDDGFMWSIGLGTLVLGIATAVLIAVDA